MLQSEQAASSGVKVGHFWANEFVNCWFKLNIGLINNLNKCLGHLLVLIN